MSENLNKILKTAIKAAKRAGAYLKKRYTNGDAVVTANHRHDVKLDVDVNTEEIIKNTILDKFPDHGFICEESGQSKNSSDKIWIVDPLDGTVNFINQIPHFCTSIAYKINGQYQVGVVYDPIRDELFYGMRGGAAFLNKVEINRRNISSMSEAIVAGGFFKTKSIEKGRSVFKSLAPNIKKIRFFGSAALDLCYLAAGRFNIYLQYHLHEWDIAAGLLISELSGVKFEIHKDDQIYNVMGAGPLIFEDLQNFLSSLE